jgi:FAD/FMN-containing dehydrogenase
MSTVMTSAQAARQELVGMEDRLVGPEDPGYEDARQVYNAMIDRRPGVVARPSGAAEVAQVVDFAREHELLLAVRGGGHNGAGLGTCDGGVVLDLTMLRGIEVDPVARTVRVGGGCTWGEVDHATNEHGLATPSGIISTTGVGGLTLGGGLGHLTRRCGLAIDNLLEAEVVLATGERVTASETEHPDLFWGLRGGGGNFGIVTAFTFRAHPLDPDAFAGSLVYERERWGEALRAYLAWTAGLPDELTTLITFLVPPPDWELGDRPLMFLGFAWAGADRAAGRAQIDRLIAACPPDVPLLDPTRWLTFQTAFDGAMPKGVRAYWRNAWFDRFDDAAIDAIVEHCGRQAWVGTAADLHHMGGAFGRVPEDATAFPSRAAAFWLNIYGFWADPADDAARTAWVKGVSDGIRPLAMAGQYVNFLGRDEGDPRAKALAVYGPAKYERLVAVKRRYDPDNLFRINHNIPPEG